ncbi:GH1 family beta-glucosidase [Fredinandcohnia quinoae]|uniref:Beta-glucosidase n=1 Tax=Fredinandcohnia quinoae TaxID=2918902 RepID=A0AAW5E5Y8_9BACI|nr:GH1 family beta-glucosidase [Fredinandcohnia sp. SECRCQ15]MCH1624543.1 GH1 family beta-glucosidase [Fredinandcohnia sp. SECRCQ15]
MRKFGESFVFGTATSSYQVEGGAFQDGRTPSIWDTFANIPGKVFQGNNGAVACDHYHLYKEDIQIIKNLGVESYRFSIAWPRIFPEEGIYNESGMKFYKNLISELKANNIKPVGTLYHWDLPQWAQDQGGWASRKSLDWFREYAKKVFEELDGQVDSWITQNEPWCAAFLGYHQGVHAPGHRNMEEALKAAHHILLSHGQTVKLLKEEFQSSTPIGITLNLTPFYSASNSYNDKIAKNNAEGYTNRWFLDPIFKGCYPVDMINLFSKYVHDFSFILDEDLDTISVECDFFGVNYYSRGLVEFNSASDFLFGYAHSEYDKTSMGWDVSPKEFQELIHYLRANYTDLPIVITENGASYPDQLMPDGSVHDSERTSYIQQHLQAIAELNDEGMNISGYFVWSLLDNFEWAFGYNKRFGIVYVDFETQKRTLKDSAKFYRDVVMAREV